MPDPCESVGDTGSRERRRKIEYRGIMTDCSLARKMFKIKGAQVVTQIGKRNFHSIYLRVIVVRATSRLWRFHCRCPPPSPGQPLSYPVRGYWSKGGGRVVANGGFEKVGGPVVVAMATFGIRKGGRVVGGGPVP